MAPKIEVQIVGDSRDLSRAFQSASRDADRFGSSLGGKLKSGFAGLAKGAAMAGAAVGTAFAATIAVGVKQLEEEEHQLAITTKLLENLGKKTDITTGQVKKWAGQLQDATGMQDDMIESVENMLLKFEPLSSNTGAFKRATELSLDLSVALGKDATTAATALGKALADPEKAAGKLAKMGVVLTESQQKVIEGFMKTGDQTKATNYLLGLLEGKFHGVAKAAGDTLGGQVEKMKRRFEDFAQSIAEKVIPVATRILDWAGEVAKAFREGGIGAALGVVAEGFKTALGGLKDIAVTAFNAIKDALQRVDWDAVFAAIGRGASALGDVIGRAFQAINWSAVASTAAHLFWTAFTTALGAAGNIVSALGPIGGAILGFFATLKFGPAIAGLATIVTGFKNVGTAATASAALMRVNPIFLIASGVAIAMAALSQLGSKTKEIGIDFEALTQDINDYHDALTQKRADEEQLASAHDRVIQSTLTLESAQLDVNRALRDAGPVDQRTKEDKLAVRQAYATLGAAMHEHKDAVRDEGRLQDDLEIQTAKAKQSLEEQDKAVRHSVGGWQERQRALNESSNAESVISSKSKVFAQLFKDDMDKMAQSFKDVAPSTALAISKLGEFATAIGHVPTLKEIKAEFKGEPETMAALKRVFGGLDQFNTNVDKSANKAQTAGQNIGSAFGGVADKVAGSMRNVAGAVTGALDGAKTAAVNSARTFGPAIGAGIASGMSGVAAQIASALGPQVQAGIQTTAANYLGAHSPSTYAATHLGEPIPQGIAAGIETGWKWVDAALKKLGGKALTGIQSLGTSITGGLEKAMAGFSASPHGATAGLESRFPFSVDWMGDVPFKAPFDFKITSMSPSSRPTYSGGFGGRGMYIVDAKGNQYFVTHMDFASTMGLHAGQTFQAGQMVAPGGAAPGAGHLHFGYESEASRAAMISVVRFPPP